MPDLCLKWYYSIRKSAKEIEISIQTFFDWRHKLFTSFSSVSMEGFQGRANAFKLSAIPPCKNRP